MRDTGYREALLTYIDILGFRKIIERSATDPSIIATMLNVLRDLKKQSSEGGRVVREEGKERPISIFRGFNFSDLTVRATFADTSTKFSDVLKWEFLYVSGIQIGLICQQDFLLRGAVALGQISMEPDRNVADDILFGPALVRAYELDSGPPRIIVDSPVIDRASKSGESLWPEYIRQDNDGQFFIDYLFGAAVDGLLLEASQRSTVTNTLKAHKESVERKVESQTDKDVRILEKLRWLVSYHNSTVQRLKKHYGQKPEAFDIFGVQPFDIPDSLMIDSVLSNTL
jgi:hypothetical protein